jgi:hypothetical protein
MPGVLMLYIVWAALGFFAHKGRVRTGAVAPEARSIPRSRRTLSNQNPIFREPENRRGMEYWPCTIVLSFDSR